MKLLALSKFLWRGDEYNVGDVFEADDEKGAMFVGQGYASELASDSEAAPAEAQDASLLKPATETSGTVGESPAATEAKPKKSKKKKR